MLVTVIPAARPVLQGDRSLLGKALFVLLRGHYIFTRAVPELLWAMLIVFVVSPGMIAGSLALAIHNFGILGKLCTEVVENLDRKPLRALQSTGAGRAQVLLYGVLPLALPSLLTFILYRREVIIRTTIVVGFVGAAGLGREFRLSMSFFHCSDIILILIAYVALVYVVDLVSVGLRRLAR